MTEPTSDQWADARQQIALYQSAAKETAQMLVSAAQSNHPEGGARVVQQIFDRHDLTFTMLVFGQLAMRVVSAERHAQNPGSPLLTPDETGINIEPVTPWETAVTDQMEAAVAQGEIGTAAAIAVNAHLRSMDVDESNGHTIDFSYLFRAMLLLNQQAVSLEAAEMMRRLRENG